jgi:hypothetical protein
VYGADRDGIRDSLRANPAEAPRLIDWLLKETPKRKKELAHLYAPKAHPTQ